MRPRFLIFCLFFILLIFGFLLWRRPVQPSSGGKRPRKEAHGLQVPGASVSNAQQGGAIIAPAAISTVTNVKTIEIPLHKQLQTREGFQQYVESKNVPVDFYGQFIDQNSNALPGVKIDVAIRHWTVPVAFHVGSKEIRLQRTSDASGRFEIHGETGDGFDIESVQKAGYGLEPGQRSFGPVGGSYESPVIFKMWSNKIHEKLITGSKAFHIVPDGRPYFINLTDDTISESGTGDLKVWIQYTNQIVRGQSYEWSAGIQVINGGLLEEPLGTAMYEAPSDGYVPSFELKQQIKGGQSGEIGERQFYLQLKSGQEYGQISIDLYAPWNNQIPGLIRLSYAINPSGSRILR